MTIDQAVTELPPPADPRHQLLWVLHTAWKNGVTEHEDLFALCMSEDLPREAYAPAVSSFISSFVSGKTKVAQDRVMASARRVRELHAKKIAGDTTIDPKAYRTALIEHYREMVQRSFYVPSERMMKSWGEATVDEHLDHIRYRKALATEHQRVISMHEKAVAFLDKYKFPTINSITDEDLIIKLVMSLL